MDFRDYLRVLHKNWIVIVVCTLVGVAGGAIASLITTPRYVSTAELYVNVRSAAENGTSDLVQGTSFARQAVASWVSIADSAMVLEPVIDGLGLDLSTAQLAKLVDASSSPNTTLIDVTVTHPDSVLAAEIANAVGESLRTVVVDVLEKPDDATSPVRIELVQPAVPAASAASPNVVRNLAIGFWLGAVIGAAIAVLRHVLDTRIRSARDIETITDTPILGTIADDPDAKRRPLAVHNDPRSPRSESFRALRTNLKFIGIDSGSRVFVVTSSLPGEGKSTTATNLAIALAETGASVVVIDGDLRLPRIADYMSVEGAVGLTDVLIGRVELQQALQRWGRGRLFVLPSGQLPPNPSEVLGSAAMARLIETLAQQVDYVIIDAPPLLRVTDAAVIGDMAAGVVMVAASGRTKKPELTAAIRALETAGGRMLGIVMTMVPLKGPDSHGYGVYGYGDTSAPVETLEPAASGRRVG